MWAELAAWFHGLSGKEKAGLAAAVVATAGLGWYIHKKESAGQASQPSGSSGNGTVYDVNGNPMNGPTNVGTGGTGGGPVATGPLPVNPIKGPSQQIITVGKDVPANITVNQLAQQYNTTVAALNALNTWGGPAGSGLATYNPNLPGNLNGLEIHVP